MGEEGRSKKLRVKVRDPSVHCRNVVSMGWETWPPVSMTETTECWRRPLYSSKPGELALVSIRKEVGPPATIKITRGSEGVILPGASEHRHFQSFVAKPISYG